MKTDTHCDEWTVAEIQQDYDWGEVFADQSSGNTTKDLTVLRDASDAPFTRDDVSEVVWAAVERGDYAETDCAGLFRLKDGRWLCATGSCDTTGWDCRAGNDLVVGGTIQEVAAHGLGIGWLSRYPRAVEAAYLPPGWDAKDGWMGPASDWWEEQDRNDYATLLRQIANEKARHAPTIKTETH